MQFWPDFIKLKTSVCGDRAYRGYGERFGQPGEEGAITPIAPHNKRILSQLEFAIRLTEARDGAFDQTVGAVLRFLSKCMEIDGVLTKSACRRAEELLSPMQEAAKEYKLIVTGCARMDTDAMRSYHETVAAVLTTFRTVLSLMEQYPDFCFSQSRASVYKMVEEYDPDMMAQIKARIREGRWEVTASQWVETDKHMPSAESLLRHIRYTGNYLRRVWGVDDRKLQIDFSPDTFGHSAFIPEIDRFGGVKYLYRCGDLDGDQSLCRWRAPSGRELLVCRGRARHDSGITPGIGLGLIDSAKTCGGLQTGLIVCGVDAHGGCARRDIGNAIEMQSWPVWPTVKFGTFAEFFREAESVRDKLPVLDREPKDAFDGCYTTQTRIKAANRRAEALLGDAESWLAFSGGPFRRDRHEAAWQNVLWAQSQDLITGSCGRDARENALGRFSGTFAYARTELRRSLECIAASIDTSAIETDADCGSKRIFHIFNSDAAPRKLVAELTVRDWLGDIRRLRITDSSGRDLRFQLSGGDPHRGLRILAEADVPAMGYTTVILREEETDSCPCCQPPARSECLFDDIVLENEHIQAVFHRNTGCLISLTDKATGEEFLDGPAALAVVTQEQNANNALKLGRYLKTELLTDLISLEHQTGGALQQSFTASYKWGMSKLKVTPILRAGEKALRFFVEVEWNEVAGPDPAPLLAFRVPHSEKIGKYLCDVPAGAVYREPRNQDIPCLKFCAAIRRSGSALALMPDSRYGYRAEPDALSVTLINTANGPDPFADRGLHTVSIALAIGRDDAKELEDTANCFSHPTCVLSNDPHPGELPLEQSYLRLEAASTVISAVLPADEPDSVLVRFYEIGGSDDDITLHFSRAVVDAVTVDLTGREGENDLVIDGNTVSLTAWAYSLGAVKVMF